MQCFIVLHLLSISLDSVALPDVYARSLNTVVSISNSCFCIAFDSNFDRLFRIKRSRARYWCFFLLILGFRDFEMDL